MQAADHHGSANRICECIAQIQIRSLRCQRFCVINNIRKIRGNGAKHEEKGLYFSYRRTGFGR